MDPKSELATRESGESVFRTAKIDKFKDMLEAEAPIVLTKKISSSVLTETYFLSFSYLRRNCCSWHQVEEVSVFVQFRLAESVLWLALRHSRG